MTRASVLAVAVLAATLTFFVSAADAAYQFQTAWGSAGSSFGQFSGPLYVAVGPDGSVYVDDAGNNRIQKFTADGAFVTAWGAAGTGPGQFGQPLGVGVGPDGTVYVADRNNNRVERFDSAGTFLSQWGTSGSLDGQFNIPTGVAVGPDGSVYVADSGNKRVEKFLADGTFLSSFTSGAGGFGSLQDVATGPDGSVYTVDAEPNSRIEHFDANGAFLGSWGSLGSGDGQFSAPRTVAVSSQGVYVTDGSRVEKFTADGAFVDSLTGPSSGDAAFNNDAWGVALSPTGAIYLSFNGDSRIARYGETTSGGPGGGGNLPPPETGTSANAQPVSGTVKVKKPGSNQFELLNADEQIPIGSIVDVTKGTVSLTTTSTAKTTQTAKFYSGVFQLLQDKAKKPTTELRLFGGDFSKAACGGSGKASAAAAKKKKVVRQLWGQGKGRFRTKGRYAAATIRGTQWLTQDRCDGTNIRVKQGVVVVRDLVDKVNVTVRAPKSVFVPKTGLRKRPGH